MSRITERIHYSCPFIGDPVVEEYNICCRYFNIFGKRAINIYTNPDGIFANMLFSAAAIPAMTAGQVTFTGDTVTDFKISYTGPYIRGRSPWESLWFSVTRHPICKYEDLYRKWLIFLLLRLHHSIPVRGQELLPSISLFPAGLSPGLSFSSYGCVFQQS
jgi:hypothetical protein